MSGGAPDLDRPDASAAHRALQEALRAPDTLAAADRASRESASPLKRFLGPLVVRAVHVFAGPQVEWNLAVSRALEAIVRSLDERDRWIESLALRLRAAEDRSRQLETDLRAAREAQEDVRKKLALAGIRLRDLEERLHAGRSPDPR